MSLLANFTIPTPRALPVILLLDCSGSMNANGIVGALNRAVLQMLQMFGKEDSATVEIQVGIITFSGDGAQLHLDLQPASSIINNWIDMTASGKTPMGSAFRLAAELVNDRQR